MTWARLGILLPLFLAQFSWSAVAADDPLIIELSAQAGGQQQAARGRAVTAAPAAGVARPVLTAKTRERLRIRWSVMNQEKTGSITGVTVHVVLDRDISADRAPVATDVLYESAILTDLTAQRRSTGDFVVEAPDPGTYRLRVETIGAAKTRGSEFVASINVQVVP